MLNRIKWFTGGKITNPAAGAVLADTGSISTEGEYFVYVTIASDVAGDFSVQHRDANNASNIGVHHIRGIAGTTSVVIPVEVSTGERIRVISDAALTGTVAASIVYARRSEWQY